MLGQLFDRETGRLKNDSPIDSRFTDDSTVVEAVRQVCRAFTKVESQCSPARVERAIEGFVHTERALSSFTISDTVHRRFIDVARYLWDVSLSGFTPDELRPKHGPGTTAEGIKGNQKYRWLTWHERLEPYFPFLGFALPLGAAGAETSEFENVTFLQEGEELPVKVTPVPKTMKGPRIIAIEPACMQYTQQSLRSWLYARIERSSISGGHVLFRDQSINQTKALIGSENGSLATLDLSDASDRVPLSLVQDMFLAALGDDTLLWECILACRSTYAKLPDGRVIGPLKKFASMGSALCFPVEAMYFYTSCVEALLFAQNLPVTRETVETVSRDVHVYGDDLIVPSTYAVAIVERLQQYNCKVNSAKSFWTGRFRESCGLDAYGGRVVTPTYIRKLHPDNRRLDDVFISFVETANLFYKRGYWRTSAHLFEVVERYLGPLPFVRDDTSVLGRVTFMGGRTIERWNSSYQRFEVKGWVPMPSHRTDEVGDYSALGKSLALLETRDFVSLDPEGQDPLHLERTARYGVATLKRRWAEA
jgi:hypothetical protein